MSQVRVKIIGYGVSRAAREIILANEKETLKFQFKRKLFLGIREHAIAELNMLNCDTSFFQPEYKAKVLFKRMISLGLSSHRLFSGIFNGFVLTATMDIDFFSSAPKVVGATNDIYISRAVGRSGIRLSEYRPILEYSIRRRQLKEDVVLLSSSIEPSNISISSFKIQVENICESRSVSDAKDFLNRLPRWHGLRTHFSLAIDNPHIFESLNTFYPVYVKSEVTTKEVTVSFEANPSEVTSIGRNKSERPIFILSRIHNARLLNGVNIVKNGYIYFTDTSENHASKSTAMWPAINWSLSNSELVAVPPYDSAISQVEESNFLPKNTNWAHFLEDIAPQAILLQQNCRTSWLSESVDDIQYDLLQALGLKSILIVDSCSNIDSKLINFVSHINVRNKLISGQNQDDFFSVDVSLMKELRLRVNRYFSPPSSQAVKVFIPRETGLFRKLVNQSQIASILSKRDFKPIYMGNLSLKERVLLLSNCSHLIYVYGAAGVNAYFCPDNCQITELRHPEMTVSREHLGLVATTGASWKTINGNHSGPFGTLLHGSDSWRISTSLLKKLA